MRDSAGIRIVENDHTRPVWTEETAWRLSAEPVVQIGSADGADGDLLHRVTDARILGDGRIAIVNSGSHEIRILDPEGQPLATLGGEGEGPGEFRSARALYPVPADSLVVVDLYRAVSVFGPDLDFERRFTHEVPTEFQASHGYEPVDAFGDGSLLLRAHLPRDPDRRGVSRNRIRMVRGFLDGSIASLGEFDDQTADVGSNKEYLFGPWAKEAAGDSTMWYGPGDMLEFREVGFDGTVRTLVRLDRPSRPVTDGDIERYVAARLERVRGTPEEQFARQRLEDPAHPDSFPAHYEMETDDDGNLWVQDYRSWVSEAGVDRIWTVFDPEGRYLGDVTVPAGLRVFTIHTDRLIGVHYDDLGVERVRIYAIEKPE